MVDFHLFMLIRKFIHGGTRYSKRSWSPVVQLKVPPGWTDARCRWNQPASYSNSTRAGPCRRGPLPGFGNEYLWGMSKYEVCLNIAKFIFERFRRQINCIVRGAFDANLRYSHLHEDLYRIVCLFVWVLCLCGEKTMKSTGKTKHKRHRLKNLQRGAGKNKLIKNDGI